MSKKRDATKSKKLILQNAIKLFSKNDFSSVSMDTLAKECDLNKAMIFYYFKNKKGLYNAVIIKVLDDIYNAVLEENQKYIDATDKIKSFIKCFSTYAWNNPYLASLLLRELSHSGEISNTLFSNMKKLYKLFYNILESGDKTGEFNDASKSSMMLYFMITGTINLMITTKTIRVEAKQNDNLNTNIEFDDKKIASYLIQQLIAII